MNSNNTRWWLVALATVGLATATISLGWLASPPVSTVGFLVAMGAGLWHQRVTRLATEDSLREREGLINVVVDGAIDAIMTIDSHGTVASFNPAAEQVRLAIGGDSRTEFEPVVHA